jgi:putative ABC transport system permease protein
MQQDPVVNMRIERIRGYSRSDVEADSTLEIPDWPFRREYRVTYRAELSPSETIMAGEWIGEAAGADIIPVSIEEEHAERIGVQVGDRLVFDIQGVPMEARVASLRKVSWNRVSSNFFVVFPTGVIEQAPQFHILMTRVPGPEASAAFQQAVLQQFPTVSIINLGQILNTVEEVLGKVSFVIRFMALFSIFTGLIVLVSSVSLSRFQRLQESVLLRTLGSSRRQILIITLFEYFILGSLAALTGIGLAFLGTWALAYFSFETVFQPAIAPVFFIYLFITGLTMLIGYLNSRSVIRRPPLEVLRAEA